MVINLNKSTNPIKEKQDENLNKGFTVKEASFINETPTISVITPYSNLK
jgi:hypothetical protein